MLKYKIPQIVTLTLNLHLTYFSETLYSDSPQTNKKALIPLRIRAFPNFAFLRSGAYGSKPKIFKYNQLLSHFHK